MAPHLAKGSMFRFWHRAMDRYGCKMRNQWTKTQYNVYIYIYINIIIIIINYYLLLLLIIIIITIIIIIIYYYYYIIYNRIYVYYVYMYNKLVSCIKPAFPGGILPYLDEPTWPSEHWLATSATRSTLPSTRRKASSNCLAPQGNPGRFQRDWNIGTQTKEKIIEFHREV